MLKKLLLYSSKDQKSFPGNFLYLRRFLKINNNTRSERNMFALYSKWVTFVNLI